MCVCKLSCVLYVATCVCTADIDIPLAEAAEASVFKVSALSSRPGVPALQQRGGIYREQPCTM